MPEKLLGTGKQRWVREEFMVQSDSHRHRQLQYRDVIAITISICWVLCTTQLFQSFMFIHNGVCSTIVHISHVMNKRHRGIMKLAWVTYIASGGAGIWTQAVWLQGSHSYPLWTTASGNASAGAYSRVTTWWGARVISEGGETVYAVPYFLMSFFRARFYFNFPNTSS